MIIIVVGLIMQMIFQFDLEKNGIYVAIFNLIFSSAYFIYYHAKTGATPGKKLMEIQVISIDGNPLSLLQSTVRYLPYSVFILIQLLLVVDIDAKEFNPQTRFFYSIFFVWHFMCVYYIIKRADKSAVHDLIAYTRVIYNPSPRVTVIK
ncbi:MAG: RDD family protein [Alphaproteobacteria bacterium]|nr:RDD family protein [Alphaproteobacteria bacterium]